MQGRITDLTDDDRFFLDVLRNWLRSHFKEGEQASYDTLEGKLSVVQAILQNRWFDPTQEATLLALGVGVGDALSQKLGMRWVIVEDEIGKSPILELPRTTLRVSALTMIQKRIMQGENEIDVFALFEGFCRAVEQIRAPKRSFFGRLFGPHLR